MKTEEKDIFLSTRGNIDLYSYIIGATKKHAEYKFKKKLKLQEYSNSKKISLKLIYHLLKIILLTNLLKNHKLSKFKLYNCEIGRHVISTCYSDYLAHFNSFSLFSDIQFFLSDSYNFISDSSFRFIFLAFLLNICSSSTPAFFNVSSVD